MKMKFLSILLLCILGLFYSGTEADTNENVYIAGTEYPGDAGMAKFWNNGKAMNLTDGTKNADATSIAISGKDAYVAGHEHIGNYDVATYWKNGEAVRLSAGTNYSDATAIAVAGTNVYVAGIEYTRIDGKTKYFAKYWKNGVSVNLSDGSPMSAA